MTYDPKKPANIPPLVGVTGAAAILGIAKSNIERLRQQGKMPEAIEVEGVKRSTPVYVKSEVETLAAQLASDRAE
jgi:hypothetical protein